MAAPQSVSSASSWALFKEQVDDAIIKAAQPKIIYPLLYKVFPANGAVMEFNTTNSWINPSEVSESGEYPNVAMNFSRQKVSIRDVGLKVPLPINYIKDSRWSQMDDYVEAAGFGMARYVNDDALTGISTFTSGGTFHDVTYSAQSPTHDVAATATWASTSADILTDISKTLAVLENDDVGDGKKYLILNPTLMSYVRTDPNLVKFINYGDASLVQKGVYPTPFGVDILATSQAASTIALLSNVDLAALKYYEREPLSVEMEKTPGTKMLSVVTYMRYALACGRQKGLAKITGAA
jgi:hypothetical protein